MLELYEFSVYLWHASDYVKHSDAVWTATRKEMEVILYSGREDLFWIRKSKEEHCLLPFCSYNTARRRGNQLLFQIFKHSCEWAASCSDNRVRAPQLATSGKTRRRNDLARTIVHPARVSGWWPQSILSPPLNQGDSAWAIRTVLKNADPSRCGLPTSST